MIAGSAVLLVALFVVREVAAGALREAGGDLWTWIKRTVRQNRTEGVYASPRPSEQVGNRSGGGRPPPPLTVNRNSPLGFSRAGRWETRLGARRPDICRVRNFAMRPDPCGFRSLARGRDGERTREELLAYLHLGVARAVDLPQSLMTGSAPPGQALGKATREKQVHRPIGKHAAYDRVPDLLTAAE
jgi:hypothetical protein